MVRIAVVQGEESVRFEADGSFTVEDDCHSKKTEGKPGEVWEVRLKDGQAANFAHYVRSDLLTDDDEANQVLKERQSQDPCAHLLCVGQRVEHQEKVILDNREYWVCMGPYASEEEAGEVRARSELGKTALVLPEMTGVPCGHIEVLGPDGMVRCLGRRVRVQTVDSGQIILHDTPVGRDFHWQHREKLSYRGTVEFFVGNDGKLLVVNELPLEEYLVSVNSSEMDARCPLELLKAQTVAARATASATMGWCGRGRHRGRLWRRPGERSWSPTARSVTPVTQRYVGGSWRPTSMFGPGNPFPTCAPGSTLHPPGRQRGFIPSPPRKRPGSGS
jgi:hypothetical protein